VSDTTTTTTSSSSSTIVIECVQCELLGSDACRDCLVTFVLDREPDDAVVIDAAEARAVRMLGRAGLLPRLRFSERAS